MKTFKTSESVTEGHPDKICDIIADAVLDRYLMQDHDALVSVKALAAKDTVCIAGEVAGLDCKDIDIEEVIRRAIRTIGYTDDGFGFKADTVEIIDRIDRHDIRDNNKIGWKEGDLHGARDQGIAFGYACDETKELMPLPITMAHELARGLAKLRKCEKLNYLKPDGKTQVTVEYDLHGDPKRIDAVVVSTMHDVFVTRDQIEQDLKERLILPVCGNLIDDDTLFFINPTGRFIVGGPAVDTGLTGRKLIVDTYGEAARHGGGAFSGKDPTSTDRCGAYLARYIAKNIVAAGLARECEIEVAYAIGNVAPIHLTVDTRFTGIVNDGYLQKIIEENFDLTITGSLNKFNLKSPIYTPTAAYGHFGRPDFAWELTDKADELRKIGAQVEKELKDDRTKILEVY